MTTPGLAAEIAGLSTVTEDGVWYRHTTAHWAPHALDGHPSDGRWGTADGFPVLYLGRPEESVTIEAYRHLVDPLIFDDEGDRAAFIANINLVFVTSQVNVTQLVDLRTASARAACRLTLDDLKSPANDPAAYGKCRTAAQVAHQLGRHGVIAPAATGTGETLALFTDQLPKSERPVRHGDDVMWAGLPPDPRDAGPPILRVIRPNR